MNYNAGVLKEIEKVKQRAAAEDNFKTPKDI